MTERKGFSSNEGSNKLVEKYLKEVDEDEESGKYNWIFGLKQEKSGDWIINLRRRARKKTFYFVRDILLLTSIVENALFSPPICLTNFSTHVPIINLRFSKASLMKHRHQSLCRIQWQCFPFEIAIMRTYVKHAMNPHPVLSFDTYFDSSILFSLVERRSNPLWSLSEFWFFVDGERPNIWPSVSVSRSWKRGCICSLKHDCCFFSFSIGRDNRGERVERERGKNQHR